MPASRRDPVSIRFDEGARRFLARAYAHPGQWVNTRVADPLPWQVAYFAAQGINVLGRDQWGRPRWVAGFIRACHYQHKWHYAKGRFQAERRTTPNRSKPVSIEIGIRKPVLGVIPAGRAVRIISRRGGQAAMNAVQRKPDSRRIYDDDGNPAARWADPSGRDW